MRRRCCITGETRIKRWFAILPVRIGADWRWLEFVTVQQSYNTRCFGWNNDRFIDYKKTQNIIRIKASLIIKSGPMMMTSFVDENLTVAEYIDSLQDVLEGAQIEFVCCNGAPTTKLDKTVKSLAYKDVGEAHKGTLWITIKEFGASL